MRIKYILLLLLLLSCHVGNMTAQSRHTAKAMTEVAILQMWKAGGTVSQEAVEEYGLEKCFTAMPVPDAVWAGMQGKTYRENPYIGRDDLRLLRVLHWDYDQKVHLGEMVCNRRIAKQLTEIFRVLYDNHYPIQRMVLPDVYDADDERQMRDNNTSCFCFRGISGGKKLSKHALGLAVDLNPLYNPYYKKQKNGQLYVQPGNAAEYCNRSKDFPYKIDDKDLAYKLFTEAGFTWGGRWKTVKDFQHFEWDKHF